MKLSIYFPPTQERELHGEMKRLATSPWSPQDKHPMGRKVEDGHFFFHRDWVDDEPACTVYIHREEEGHWTILAIVEEEDTARISTELRNKILREFDSKITEPAAESIEGRTELSCETYKLEDYFHHEAVKLFRTYEDEISHGFAIGDTDFETMWIRTLIVFYRTAKNPMDDKFMDNFSRCLQIEWLSEEERLSEVEKVEKHITQFRFAMRLLSEYDKTNNS